MVRCKSAIVPPWPFVGSGVTVVVVAREIVLQRLVGLGLVAAVLALAPSADASPPDQTWIAGLYDNADFDEVILFITTGLGDVQPGLLCSRGRRSGPSVSFHRPTPRRELHQAPSIFP